MRRKNERFTDDADKVVKDIKDALNQKIVSRANGVEKKITTREGIIMRLIKKALDGDHNAIKLIMVKDEDFQLETLLEGEGAAGSGNSGSAEPADAIDEAILVEFMLSCTLSDEATLLDCLDISNLSAEQISQITSQGKQLTRELNTAKPDGIKSLLQALINEIKIEDDQIAIRLCSESLLRRIDSTFSEKHCHQTVTITKDITIRKRGQEMKLVLGGIAPIPENKDTKLIKLIAKAHLLRIELETKVVDSIKTFAAKYKLDHADAKNLIPLSYLAPTIIEDILAGHQPVDLNVKKLKSLAKQLPLNWSEQRELLGFAS